MTSRQLTLAVRLPDDMTFASFYPGANNTIIAYLQAFIATPKDFAVYLWGSPGVGRSHLLQACCQQAGQQGLRTIYLSLAHLKELTPNFFNDLELCDLVCIDDLQAIAGKPGWEEAVFHFYNRLQAANSHLLIAADKPPANVSIRLPDLLSRLTNSTVFQLHPLNDQDKLRALQSRAKLKGLMLSDEAGNFLLSHCPRDLPKLFLLLEELDQASLAAQRKITIPFIKTILDTSL